MADVPRIVIALDPTATETGAFDVLRYFQGIDIDLAGVFIEDAHLLSHARSSLARVVVPGGSEDRELALESLERQLRASSAKVQQYFESAARTLRGRHSFQVARGTVVDEIERYSANCEVLVVNVARAHRGLRARWGADIHRLARTGTATTVFVRNGSTPNTIVTVVLRGLDDLHAVWPTAVRVARAGPATLRVLVVSDAPGSSDPVRARIAAESAELALPTRFDAIGDRSASTLRQAVGTSEGCTLILPGGDQESDADLVRELLAQTNWTLMLIRNALIV